MESESLGLEIYNVRTGDKTINNEVLSRIKDVYSCSVKEGKLLYKLAKQCTGKGVIVEIGSWKGYSTIWLADGSKAGNSVPIFAIDTFEGDKLHYGKGETETYQEFMRNITDAGVRDIITPIVKTSEEAEIGLSLKPVELLWIDGDHDDIENDFWRWYYHVVDGGVIALHDTVAWPSMNPWKVAERMYRSGDFRDVQRVGSITFGYKSSHITTFDKLKNYDALIDRYGYQLLIPYYLKCQKLGGKLLGK